MTHKLDKITAEQAATHCVGGFADQWMLDNVRPQNSLYMPAAFFHGFGDGNRSVYGNGSVYDGADGDGYEWRGTDDVSR